MNDWCLSHHKQIVGRSCIVMTMVFYDFGLPYKKLELSLNATSMNTFANILADPSILYTEGHKEEQTDGRKDRMIPLYLRKHWFCGNIIKANRKENLKSRPKNTILSKWLLTTLFQKTHSRLGVFPTEK